MTDAPKAYSENERSRQHLPLSSLSQLICEEWLEEKSRTVKPISYDKYENVTYKYIMPFLSDYPIETLNEEIINDYMVQQKQSGLSSSMVKILKITLKGIYTYREKNYHLSHIDFSQINVSQDITNKSIVLDNRSEKILYDYCMSHVDSLGVVIMLCLYGGLRFSELCALKYSDVDLSEGSINVDKKVQRSVNRENTGARTQFHTIELSYPEKRKVILSNRLIDYLKSYMGNKQVDCYLLSRKPILKEQRKYQNMLKDLGNKYGFEVNYTILRNTCKQRCLASGMDINTMMSTLGLSRIEINREDTHDFDNTFKRQEMGKLIPFKE